MSKMSWYRSLSRGTQIGLAVLAGHGFLLCILGVDHWMHRVKTPKQKVVVNTFVLKAPPVHSAPKTPTVTSQKPKKQSAQPIARIATPQKATVTQPTQKIEKALLAEIEKNLESLTIATPVVKKAKIAIPDLHFSPESHTIEHSGAEQIAKLLQESLELPEFGVVKIKLSINTHGTLEGLEILEAKSQKNAEFLKKRLPELQFPCLNKSTTLTIVFSNAI